MNGNTSQDNDLMEELRRAGLLSDDEIQNAPDERIIEAVEELPEDEEFEEVEEFEPITNDLNEEEQEEINHFVENTVEAPALAVDVSVSTSETFSEPSTLKSEKKAKTPKPPKLPKPPREPKAPKVKVAKTKSIHGTESDRELVAKLPKKIAEKANQMLEHIANGKKLSVYTKIGLEMLKTKGSLTMRDLVTKFNDGSAGKAYSIGTSRSQAQQVVSLFSRFDIIDASGKPNTENTRFSKLFS